MRDKIIYILGAVALILLARDIYLFTGFPPERNQGVIFKIIFFHVPMAITALTCAMVAFIASVLFLITKQFKYDALAVAVTEVGLAFLAGNLITETLFNYRGLGLLFYNSLQQVDYNVMLAYTLLGAILVVVGNLIADIALTMADPRIRLA